MSQDHKEILDDFDDIELNKIFLGLDDSSTPATNVDNDDAPSPKKKRRGGHKKKWTDEKVEQYHADRKLRSQIKRDVAKEARRHNDFFLSDADRVKKAQDAIRSRTEIDELIVQKRKELDASLGRQRVDILNRTTRCTDHDYEVSNILASGNLETNCSKCSKQKIFGILEWKKYQTKKLKGKK